MERWNLDNSSRPDIRNFTPLKVLKPKNNFETLALINVLTLEFKEE